MEWECCIYLLLDVKNMDGHANASLPSRIAALVHAHFDALPQRSKPIVRPDTREWTPMSSVVVVRGK